MIKKGQIALYWDNRYTFVAFAYNYVKAIHLLRFGRVVLASSILDKFLISQSRCKDLSCMECQQSGGHPQAWCWLVQSPGPKQSWSVSSVRQGQHQTGLVHLTPVPLGSFRRLWLLLNTDLSSDAARICLDVPSPGGLPFSTESEVLDRGSVAENKGMHKKAHGKVCEFLKSLSPALFVLKCYYPLFIWNSNLTRHLSYGFAKLNISTEKVLVLLTWKGKI